MRKVKHIKRSDKQSDTVLDDLGKPIEDDEGPPVDASLDPARGFSAKSVAVLIAFIVVVLGVILFIASLQNSALHKTLDERHADNLAGKKATETQYLYNQFSFVNYDGLWYTQIADGNRLLDLALHYGPRDVEDISINGNLNDSFFNDTEIYITFDPKDDNLTYVSLSAAEVGLSLVNGIHRFPTAACTRNETEACTVRPIVTCENTARAVLYLDEREPKGITFDGNCIRVHGVGPDLVKAVDRLLYLWYGVMPGR